MIESAYDSVQDPLEDFDDEQLEQRASDLESRLQTRQSEPDLRTYRNRREESLKERREHGSLWYERLVEGLANLVGHTPKRRFEKRLDKARQLRDGFQEEYERLKQTYNDSRQEAKTVNQRFVKAKDHFMTRMELYKRAQERVDVLEAEVEHLSDGSATALHEKQEVLSDARAQLLEISTRTDDAGEMYADLRDRARYLNQHVERVHGDLNVIREQKTRFSLGIQSLEHEQRVRFGEKDRPALEAVYEDAAIMLQEMRSFGESYFGNDRDESFDSRFQISLGENGADEVYTRWQRIKSSSTQ